MTPEGFSRYRRWGSVGVLGLTAGLVVLSVPTGGSTPSSGTHPPGTTSSVASVPPADVLPPARAPAATPAATPADDSRAGEPAPAPPAPKTLPAPSPPPSPPRPPPPPQPSPSVPPAAPPPTPVPPVVPPPVSPPSTPPPPPEDPALPSPLIEALSASMPVRVVFVDAVTGRDVPGVRWRARSGPVPKEPTKVVVDAFWHTAGDTAVLPFPFDGIEVAAPQGRVSLRPRVIPCWPVARARSGVLTVPLFPEARVFVTLPADAPDEGFSLASTMAGTVREARIAGTTIPVRASSDTRGPQGLRGIPYLPGEELRLITAWDAGPAGRGTWCGTGTDRADSGIHFETEWIGRLRIGDNLPVLAEIPRDGQTRTSDLEDERREEETPWTSLHATRPDDDESPAGPLDPTARGAVRVRLLDRTGGPAAGVRVALRTTHLRTDAEGRATFTRFPSGEVGVRVIDSGWAFPKTRVVVQTDAIVDVEVRELSGGTLDVRVVDPDGQPVPCASLAFGREDGRFTWDLDDAGVQRLDALVGADGRRVFAHVPPGTVHVRASVGTREGRSRVEVTDGGTHVVTVTLPRRPR